jgi:hypothetical protein
MRRAVVNVGTGSIYQRGTNTLRNSVAKYGNCDFVSWQDPLPKDWPKHSDVAYGFKAFSLREASKDHDLLLWADSSVVAIRSMEPLWEKIEREGAFVPLNGWFNSEWTCDAAYEDLFPGVPLEEARERNKIPHAVATTFGMNLHSSVGNELLSEYFRLANTRAFCGPWSNLDCPEHWQQDPSRMGHCGPPSVRGHRHDQSSLSVIAHRLGITLTPCPEFFSYPPPAENTILVNVGA